LDGEADAFLIVNELWKYFISSLNADNPKQLEHAIRAHWAVENNLHWVLDMTFDEVNNQTRQGYSAPKQAGVMIIYLKLLALFKPDFTGRVRG